VLHQVDGARGGSVKHVAAVAADAPMKRLSQEEGVISPHDWKLNAEGQSSHER
jgi:hypothetical protein